MAQFAFVLAVLAASIDVAAQTSGGTDSHQHEGHATEQRDDQVPESRDGSGTSWLPDETPMYAIHRQANEWMLMGHTNAFLQYLHDAGDRGEKQAGSINWLMGMAQRPAGAGRLMLRGMVSFEPWTIGGCGYPDLLATGEFCDGEAIHDRQHPHDLFMELAAEYDRPLGKGARLQLYGGPVGEPALGPVAFMHRVSGLPNLLAPITHHWFDSTHITYGVVTGGIYGTRWKVEGSAFNGREPDEQRTDFDMAKMDSWSGRAWLLPAPRWALQVSAGRLNEAEPGHDGDPPTDINRVTASATYHRITTENTVWAHTFGWGRNAERGGDATNALFVESSVTVRERHAWYGRFEWAEKGGHDLALSDEAIVKVAKLQGGYTRYLNAWNGVTPGIGASVSLGLVPARLEPAYGNRANAGFGVYVTFRPAAMKMHGAHDAAPAPMDHSQHNMPDHSGHSMPPPSPKPAREPGASRGAEPRGAQPPAKPRLPVIEAERVIDPACAATIDLVNAPKATHEGKVYYFCSAVDRDTFLKDPPAYLKRRKE
jgi:YHS domain-containing protein